MGMVQRSGQTSSILTHLFGIHIALYLIKGVHQIMKFQDGKGYQLRTPPNFIPHKIQFKLLNKKVFIGHLSENSGFRHNWIQHSNTIRTQVPFSLAQLSIVLAEHQGECRHLFPSSSSENILMNSAGSHMRI